MYQIREKIVEICYRVEILGMYSILKDNLRDTDDVRKTLRGIYARDNNIMANTAHVVLGRD